MNNINFYRNIIDPVTHKSVTIDSKKGLSVLKNYIMNIQIAGSNILVPPRYKQPIKRDQEKFLLDILIKLKTDIYDNKNAIGANINDRYKYLVLWLEQEDKQYIIDLVKKNLNDPENTAHTITRIIYNESRLVDDKLGGYLDEFGNIDEEVTLEEVEDTYNEQLSLLEKWIEHLNTK